MFIALSEELGASPFDPTHGTVFAQQIRDGVAMSPESIQAETVRVGRILEHENIIRGFVAQVFDDDGNPIVDENGRLTVVTTWQDLAAGSPITQAFTPR